MKNLVIESLDQFLNEKKWIQDAIGNPGALKKSLGKEKLTKSDINKELSKLKKKDKDKEKPGVQLDKKDSTKYKRLNLAKTLGKMHESFEGEGSYEDNIDEIVRGIQELYRTEYDEDYSIDEIKKAIEVDLDTKDKINELIAKNFENGEIASIIIDYVHL